MKLLEENPLKWSSIIEGVHFANCISKHSSTKYSRFNLLYNREPALPIDVKYKLLSTENWDTDESFDKDIFDAVLASSNVIRKEGHRQASENVKSVQKKQQHYHESCNKSSALSNIYTESEVFWRKNNLKDQKVGKFTFKWSRPNFISDIIKKSLVKLKNG